MSATTRYIWVYMVPHIFRGMFEVHDAMAISGLRGHNDVGNV